MSADSTTPAAPLPDVPAFKPKETFWPYVDLQEQPDHDELVSLDPDLRDALYGPQARPFSVTVVFPRFEGDDYERAVSMAKSSVEYRETGDGFGFRHRARFLPDTPLALRDLFEIVGRFDQTEVLIDDRPLPYARDLWLPLFWFLIPR
jgi:hypothetical protein